MAPRKQRASSSETKWPRWVTQPSKSKRFEIKRHVHHVPIHTPLALAANPGGIRVLKIHFFRAPVSRPELRKNPVVEGYRSFNVCANQGQYHWLSPRILGPVHNEGGPEWGVSKEHPDVFAWNIEDAWQGSKVPEYAFEDHPPESDEWIPAFMEYSRRCRDSGAAKRHRLPPAQRKIFSKDNPNVPRFSYYLGKRLDYAEARGEMYCKWYAELAPLTQEYKNLLAMHLAGENIILLDYDGGDRDDPTENVDLDEESLRRRYNDASKPFGHAWVLAGCLLGIRVWEKEPETGPEKE